jgi:hypothetical protein
MKTIRNKTVRPLQIRLPGGKTLHLPALKTGQISNQAASDPAVRKLITAGHVEIEGEDAQGPAGSGDGASFHESTHGHAPATRVAPKGNR